MILSVLMESGAKGPKGATTTATLEVTDGCSKQIDGDSATLLLPKDPEGYAVYGRILGKPGKNGGLTFDFTSRELTLVEDELGNDLLLLGLVNETGAFDPITLTRYNTATTGKGALKATDITPLFEFTGDVCYINDIDFFCPDYTGLNPEGASRALMVRGFRNRCVVCRSTWTRGCRWPCRLAPTPRSMGMPPVWIRRSTQYLETTYARRRSISTAWIPRRWPARSSRSARHITVSGSLISRIS